MFDFIHRSLGLKAVLITLALGMAMGILLLWGNYVWQKELVLKEIHLSARQKADLLQMGIEEPMVVGDNDGTVDQFNKVARRYDDIEVLVASYQGKVTYATNPAYLFRNVKELEECEQLASELTESLQSPVEKGHVMPVDGKRMFVEVKSIENSPKCYHCHGRSQPILGTLVMFQSIEPQMAALKRSELNNAALSLSGLAVLLVTLMAFVNSSIVRRIRKITKASEQVSRGDLGVDFTVTGRDELARLGRYVGNMVHTIKDQLKYNQGVIKAIQAGITVIDARTSAIVDINPVAARLIGQSPETLIGKNYCDFLRFKDELSCPPDSVADSEAIVETMLVTSGGVEVPILKNQVFVRFEEQQHLIYSFIDITERKQSEEAIRRANEEKEQLLASISSVLIGVDEKGRINQWNVPAEELFGVTAEKALGQPFDESLIDWSWDKVSSGLEACAHTQRPVKIEELRFKKQNGKFGFLRMHINPVKCIPGKQCSVLILADDITELKVLEEELLQSKKLESLGQLSAGIAHEINTPTQYVGDNARFLEDAFQDIKQLVESYESVFARVKEGTVSDDDLKAVAEAAEDADLEYLEEEIPRAIEQSLDGIDRIKKIVLSMKQFSHPGVIEKSPTDLNASLESTVTISRNEWKYVADVVTDFDPSLSLVSCYPDELNQVFLNIIINAAHAIAEKVDKDSGEKGTITVASRQGEGYAEVRISDTGGGIPAAIQDRIFDPFFTTKQVGRGTGQGLNIAHTVVVEKHGGTLTFETEEGKGTTFIVRLPLEECLLEEQE